MKHAKVDRELKMSLNRSQKIEKTELVEQSRKLEKTETEGINDPKINIKKRENT